LSVPRVADALISYMLSLPGNEKVLSVNPVVGETNDGTLNDIRGRHITPDDVFAAIKNAKPGPVEEGAVGAGTGTIAFGWKGGIGTSSRTLPEKLGGYTVGVLVQTNFGGILTINGAPVGQELGQFYLKSSVAQSKDCDAQTSSECPPGRPGQVFNSAVPHFRSSAIARRQQQIHDSPDGSCMIIVATDAPLDSRNLRRLAARAIMGLARTGSSGSNGSGDYVIAFSAAPQVRIPFSATAASAGRSVTLLGNEAMSPLFEGVIEATEEAIYNSIFKATTTTGNGHTIEALPLDRTLEILRNHKALAAVH
jgi:D-aminopeptidase